MWRNENDLSDEEVFAEFTAFKVFSGQYQCRILGETGYKEQLYFPVGSGGYLKYKGNYYLVTNEHVARQKEIKDIRALCVSEGQKCAKLIDLKVDKDLDIAVFKVDASCISNFYGKSFLEEGFIVSPVS